MTPRELSILLARDAESVCRELLPAGKRQGNEWVVGSVEGEEGKSCKVRLKGPKAGRYCDFATGQSGDLIDLWGEVHQIGLKMALKQVREYLGIPPSPEIDFNRPRAAYSTPEKPKSCKTLKPQSPVMEYLAKRGLSEETLKAFKIAEDGRNIVFPYIRDDKPVMIKMMALDRENGKKKTWFTSENQEPCLFGWQALPETRSLAITEGEIDAMTLHQFGIYALSVPFGGGGGAKHKWIETEYHNLEGYDEIFLCFDQDDEGRRATDEISERLGRHRCRVVTLPHKDANECLKNGFTQKDFADCFMNSKTLDPAELKSASEFVNEVIEEFYPALEEAHMSTPWSKVGKNIQFRTEEVSLWTGINGHGKSLLLNQIVVHGMVFGEKACIASMEMPARRTLHRMDRQISGLELPSRPYIEEIHKWLADRLWLFSVVGSTKVDRILEVFTYARKRYGITQFIIDSLAKCGMAEDDYNAQKAFIEKLVDFSHTHKCHVHIVAHARKGKDESAPGKMDVKGTGALTDMVDNVFIVWRNKNKELAIESGEEAEGPDAMLMCEKQRYSGWEGRVGLYFDKKSLQYLGSESCRPTQYMEIK